MQFFECQEIPVKNDISHRFEQLCGCGLVGCAFDSCEGIQDLDTPDGVESLLDHLRTHFEPIEVCRRGWIVDDFVYDFERQPGEEIRDYDTRFNILLRRVEAVAGQVSPSG